MKRRKFIQGSLIAASSFPFLASNSYKFQFKNAPNPSGKLNILILGGTSFLGPHQVAYAMSRGHSVSTFTRGRTKPTVHQDLFARVEMLIGDRADNLKALESKSWDVVIDNSGHKVEWTRKSAELLKGSCDLYLYTSSTGVYYPYLTDNIKEDTQLLLEEPDEIKDEDMKLEYWYGVMKSNSEIAARTVFGKERTIVVRPTYMIGPADKSNRFIHWPIRLSRGGDVLVPGKKSDPVQYIDVRDVAEWMIDLIEQRTTGTFNAVGPEPAQTIHDFVHMASQSFQNNHNFINVDDFNFLKENNIPYLVPWIMPDGNNFGSARINNIKGIQNGLTFRSLRTSILDTYEWWYSDSISPAQRSKYEQDPNTFLNREKEVIKKWKRRG